MSIVIEEGTVDYVWNLSGGLPNLLEDSAGNRYVYGLNQITRINGSSANEFTHTGPPVPSQHVGLAIRTHGGRK